MKVTLSMAMSVNGIIADENGSEDFLSHDNWIAFVKLAKKIGSNIWGRRTYEAVRKWKGGYLKDLEKVKKIILSSDSSLTLDEGFALATSPKDAIKILEQDGKKEALVTGGSTINTAFIKAGFVDEVILTLEPVLLGKGIALFSPADFDVRLKLLEVNHLNPDHLELHYKVVK